MMPELSLESGGQHVRSVPYVGSCCIAGWPQLENTIGIDAELPKGASERST